jgi:hypothetical protein
MAILTIILTIATTFLVFFLALVVFNKIWLRDYPSEIPDDDLETQDPSRN